MSGPIAESRCEGKKMKAAPLRKWRGFFHESFGPFQIVRAYFLLMSFWISAGTTKTVSEIAALYSTLVTVMILS